MIIVNTAANAISANEYGPPPRIIGNGPIRMMAPPLKLLVFGSEPKAINITPTKITAKATKNNIVGKASRVGSEYPLGVAGWSFARHSLQDQLTASMQLTQIALPQFWHTWLAVRLPQIAQMGAPIRFTGLEREE